MSLDTERSYEREEGYTDFKKYTEGDLTSICLNRSSEGVGNRGWVCRTNTSVLPPEKITKGGGRDHTPVHNIII